jgi:aspartyl-tRNA(Asn)/glutamyl-tRNA(Gln) amidotransferase subunit B
MSKDEQLCHTQEVVQSFHSTMMASEEEQTRKAQEDSQIFANRMLSPFGLRFPPTAILELVALVEAKTISSSAAQQVFAEMFATGKSPAAIVQEKGLAQVSDTGAIEKFCDDAIAANPAPVEDYKAGKVAALNSLKGQVMKLSKGKANPALVGEILERKLKG